MNCGAKGKPRHQGTSWVTQSVKMQDGRQALNWEEGRGPGSGWKKELYILTGSDGYCTDTSAFILTWFWLCSQPWYFQIFLPSGVSVHACASPVSFFAHYSCTVSRKSLCHRSFISTNFKFSLACLIVKKCSLPAIVLQVSSEAHLQQSVQALPTEESHW